MKVQGCSQQQKKCSWQLLNSCFINTGCQFTKVADLRTAETGNCGGRTSLGVGETLSDLVQQIDLWQCAPSCAEASLFYLVMTTLTSTTPAW